MALVISVIAIVVAGASLFVAPRVKIVNNTINRTVYVGGNAPTTTIRLIGYNISSGLITPSVSLSDAPVITQRGASGNTLYDINLPFNASELGIVNGAPESYFEKAGEMFLNGTLNNSVGTRLQGFSPTTVPPFVVNGKLSVVYYGSITCIWCGANRWSMMLALSRFGSFSNLFQGYSALQDGDVPTVYWAPAHYTGSGADFGDFYSSNYINFIAIEDTAPITGGFSLSSPSQIESEANQTGNLAYSDAAKYMFQAGASGTPFTVWGNYQVVGADAIAFGNSTPITNKLPLTNVTHVQMMAQLADPTSQLAWTEYAGADFYIAFVCKSVGSTATAPVCSLPAIKTIETLIQ